MLFLSCDGGRLRSRSQRSKRIDAVWNMQAGFCNAVKRKRVYISKEVHCLRNVLSIPEYSNREEENQRKTHRVTLSITLPMPVILDMPQLRRLWG